MITLEEYKGKKVLITGHTGFKGGWLAVWLEKLGAAISGFALQPLYDNGIFTASGIGNYMKDHRGDVRNLNALLEVFEKEQPEIVFHLAAQALVLESYATPADTFDTNVMGTVNVLEAIRRTPSVKAAVIITTDKCYENKEWIWGYRENDPMGGHDPYSASKGAAEIVISSYRRSFFSSGTVAAIASARAGNVIGGGDWSDNRLVPDIIKSILRGEDVLIRNPHATRPWQHVLDPLAGYLMLGLCLLTDKDKYAEGWNFGPYTHQVFPVGKVADAIIRCAGRGKWIDGSQDIKPHEASILMLDITKAIQKLGWRPVISFEDAIRLTVDWYLKRDQRNILDITHSQIDHYSSLWNSGKEN
jgi:CDP-glucose 4,6-dehydratase